MALFQTTTFYKIKRTNRLLGKLSKEAIRHISTYDITSTADTSNIELSCFQNPVKAGLCEKPEDYYYSSARFYLDGLDSLGC